MPQLQRVLRKVLIIITLLLILITFFKYFEDYYNQYFSNLFEEGIKKNIDLDLNKKNFNEKPNAGAKINMRLVQDHDWNKTPRNPSLKNELFSIKDIKKPKIDFRELEIDFTAVPKVITYTDFLMEPEDIKEVVKSSSESLKEEAVATSSISSTSLNIVEGNTSTESIYFDADSNISNQSVDSVYLEASEDNTKIRKS